MSFTEDKRERIKWYILEKIAGNQKDLAKKTAETFNVSLNTVYRYLRSLEEAHIIKKYGRKYEFIETQSYVMLQDIGSKLWEEDIIYNEHIKRYTEILADNVRQIWQYSFMEMMNNVIDHSQAKNVRLLILQNYMSTTVLIADDGVGIFRKIKEYYGFSVLDDAVRELFKGKLTTDACHHSGEGIFFTSRALDKFAAISDGKIFTHDKYYEMQRNLEEIEELKSWRDKSGTIIFMQLSNFSNKRLKEVFDMFSDADGGFTKTRIPIKNIFETYPVSRSQAKRLCYRFEKFREVELDFEGVEEIGQGFAHELFVVFQNNHADVKLLPIHISKDIEKMIYHVKQTEN